MRKWIVFVALIILVGAAISFSTYDFSSPRYQGRPLIEWIRAGYVEWVRQANNSPIALDPNAPQIQKADEAILFVGTNAIPYYLACLEAPDDPHYKTVISDWLTEHVSSSLEHPLNDWADSRYLEFNCGLWGLRELGPAAKSYVPELVRLFNSATNDSRRSDSLALVIASAGTDGIPALTNFLSNPDTACRHAAVLALRSYTVTRNQFFLWHTNTENEMTNAAAIIMPCLLPLLSDTNSSVRYVTARTILRSPIPVSVPSSKLAAAMYDNFSVFSGDAKLMDALETTTPYQPTAIAILQEISRDTNSAYATQAAAILERLRSNSIPLTSH